MIIKSNQNNAINGCDFIVDLPEERKDTKIKLLQITDMQFIDSSQMRFPGRLRQDEIDAWQKENFDAQSGDQIRSLIAQTKPDLIFITGDIVYGQFDDSGEVLDWFCNFMDSFKIPWSPVYGNHDNECKKGVKWQNERFEKSEYCLFKAGSVTGNGNYVVGISVGGEIIRTLYMADSNGCYDSDDPLVERKSGIFPDQLEFFKERADKICTSTGKNVPSFMAFHIPTFDFVTSAVEKGYAKQNGDFFNIGVTVPQVDDDFGFFYERVSYCAVDGFVDFLKENRVDAVFVGHDHSNCSCISWKGIKWVFGLKTGQYDYHIVGSLGGTLITLENESFEVRHVPALVKLASYPYGGKMFDDFFVKSKK